MSRVQEDALRCATHPSVETYLRCATCGKPICPDCLVETPVGMKCRDCGRAPVPPIYRVTPARLALVVIVAVALGVFAGGFVLAWRTGFSLLLIFLAPLAGGLIAEAASRASGGKRGPVMAMTTAVSCAIGMALIGPQLLFAGASLSLMDIGTLLLRRPFVLLFMGFTVAVAFWRIR